MPEDTMETFLSALKVARCPKDHERRSIAVWVFDCAKYSFICFHILARHFLRSPKSDPFDADMMVL